MKRWHESIALIAIAIGLFLFILVRLIIIDQVWNSDLPLWLKFLIITK